MTAVENPLILGEEFLEHYGIKGMKWGVRRDESGGGGLRETIREKRLERVEKKTDLLKTRIKDLQVKNEALENSRNPLNAYTRMSNNNMINVLAKDRDRLIKDAEAIQNGKLTSTQKKVIVGAAVAGAVVAAVAVNQGLESGAINSARIRGEAFIQGRDSLFTRDKSLAGKMSADDIVAKVAKPVNPNYKKPGGQMNCRRSTFTHELRRRGYDVSATTATRGTGQSESGFINAVTPGSKNFISSLSASESVRGKGGNAFEAVAQRSSVASGDKRSNPLQKVVLDGLDAGNAALGRKSSSRRILDEVAKQPEGARGEVLLNFGSFAHSMAYEVIGGKAHIFDSQKAKKYDADSPVESKWDGFSSAEITRLDNVDLDMKFLSRWATNRG